MRMVFSPRGMLLGGILALLLPLAPAPALAEKDKPRPDPMADATRRLDAIRKLFEDQGMPPLDFPGLRGRRATPPPRLGAELHSPSETLADQLDLPKDRGLVVHRVMPDSAAARAGLRPHDILLELNGKAVSAKIDDFRKALAAIEANKPVDAVVLRKGKKETVKGLKLPEAKAAATPAEPLPEFPDFRRFEGFEGFRDLLPPAATGDRTTITRNGDQFTATRKEGKHTLTVTGKVEQGKAHVERVTVDDGDGKKTYEGMDKVPAGHKKSVEDLAAMVGGKPATEDY
jgi:membrane-associated protease RseP (regulator of RpoE activity)